MGRIHPAFSLVFALLTFSLGAGTAVSTNMREPAPTVFGRYGPWQSQQPPKSTCLVLDFVDDGIDLVPSDNGVRFDLDADGVVGKIGWTRRGSDDGFLALDTNHNGKIDSGAELLGRGFTHSSIPHSMNAFDDLLFLQGATETNGVRSKVRGNPDLEVDDEIYSQLLVWTDINHDGQSSSGELKTLEEAKVVFISAGYVGVNESQNGNLIRYRGAFQVLDLGVKRRRHLVEVALARQR